MKSNLLKAIEGRNFFRQQYKKLLDNTLDLSSVDKNQPEKFNLQTITPNNGVVRLLDEGSVLYGDASVRAYIKKGVLEEFYNSLDDDYVGSINIGHMDYSSFPFLVGHWTKKDLQLVDIGDGRKGLDVKLNIDEESIYIKELRRQHNVIGVSAEFSFSVDESVDEELLERLDWAPVIEKLTIHDFGIVGEPGNANSTMVLSGKQKEDTMKDGLVKNLFEKYFSKPKEEPNVQEPTAEPGEEPVEPTEPKGSSEPTVTEPTQQVTPDPADPAEPVVVQEPSVVPNEPAQDNQQVEAKVKDLETLVLGLKSENDALTAENKQLKADKAQQDEQLTSMNTRVSNVLKKFEKLSVIDSQGNSVTTNQTEPTGYDPVKFITGE